MGFYNKTRNKESTWISNDLIDMNFKFLYVFIKYSSMFLVSCIHEKKKEGNCGTGPLGALVGQKPGWMELLKEEGDIGFACLPSRVNDSDGAWAQERSLFNILFFKILILKKSNEI